MKVAAAPYFLVGIARMAAIVTGRAELSDVLRRVQLWLLAVGLVVAISVAVVQFVRDTA